MSKILAPTCTQVHFGNIPLEFADPGMGVDDPPPQSDQELPKGAHSWLSSSVEPGCFIIKSLALSGSKFKKKKVKSNNLRQFKKKN